MLRRLLGVKNDETNTNKVKKIMKTETLMLNVGSTQTGGRVEKINVVHYFFFNLILEPDAAQPRHTCLHLCRRKSRHKPQN